MKKKTLGLIGLCLLASACLGAGVGLTVSNIYDRQANIVMVKAEEAEEELTSESETLTEEEKTKMQELIAELNAKYKEIRDTQIFGTTIGTIVGAVVGAVVSMIPSLLNRANIRKAIEEVSLTRQIVDDNKKLAKDIKEKFHIVDEKYDKVISVCETVSESLKLTQEKLELVEKQNAEISNENKEMKELLLIIFSQSAVLTSLGVSEETFKKYLPKQ